MSTSLPVVADYEEIRALAIALIHGSKTLLGVRTENEFTDILYKQRDSLLENLRFQLRIFDHIPTQEEVALFGDDLLLLKSHLGVIVSPSQELPGRTESFGPTVLAYDSVVKRAVLENLIDSEEDLAPRVNLLKDEQPDILKKYHPLSLSGYLRELCRGRLPNGLGLTRGTVWDTFEDLVFLVLSSGFRLKASREGHMERGRHLPDGYFVIVHPTKSAVMFDCKGKESGLFSMDKDDELRFKSYVRERKQEILTLENVEVRFFAVFACDFRGNMDLRVRAVLRDTGVHLCMIPMRSFVDFCEKMYSRALEYPDIVDLIKWPDLLSFPIVDAKEYEKELTRIDRLARRF